jgi:glycosyltransferase involved in cell wall biosynthesis
MVSFRKAEFSGANGRNVLFVINSPIIGGAERHTLDLARSLRALGFDTRVFAMKDAPGDIGADVALMRPAAGTSLPRRIAQLRAEMARGDYGLVVGANERPILAAFLARRALGPAGPRLAGVLHSTILRSLREYIQHYIHFPIFMALDEIIFISENQRRFWTRKGLRPRRAITILNGVDAQTFSPLERERRRAAARAALKFGEADYVIAHCAVFRPEKNHLQLLDVLARMRGEGVPARGLLIGDGLLRQAIETRIHELNLGDAVHITGLQKDVRDFIAAADVGINCSLSIETLSLSALETLAMGVPMAMSDIGGASEIVDGANGRLFPPGDAGAMKEALDWLRDPVRREQAGRAARETVERRFDHRVMVEAYRRCFERLTEPATASAGPAMGLN